MIHLVSWATCVNLPSVVLQRGILSVLCAGETWIPFSLLDHAWGPHSRRWPSSQPAPVSPGHPSRTRNTFPPHPLSPSASSGGPAALPPAVEDGDLISQLWVRPQRQVRKIGLGSLCVCVCVCVCACVCARARAGKRTCGRWFFPSTCGCQGPSLFQTWCPLITETSHWPLKLISVITQQIWKLFTH